MVLNPQQVAEERLRYEILGLVFRRTGENCEVILTAAEIGAELNIRFEDLFRVIDYLNTRGYLTEAGAGPRVCITPDGIAYMTELAGRRRSIRG